MLFGAHAGNDWCRIDCKQSILQRALQKGHYANLVVMVLCLATRAVLCLVLAEKQLLQPFRVTGDGIERLWAPK